jgi:hypothetical protein
VTGAGRSHIGAHGLAWYLLTKQLGGLPSSSGVPLILPRKVRVSPRVETSPARGLLLATSEGRPYIPDMVRIAVSPQAFAAIVATLPGNVNVENKTKRHFTRKPHPKPLGGTDLTQGSPS